MNKLFLTLAAVFAVASLFNTPFLFLAAVFAWGVDFVKEDEDNFQKGE